MRAGDILRLDRSFEDAARYYREALLLYRSFVATIGMDTDKWNLSVALVNLGDVLNHRSALEQTHALFHESMELRRELFASRESAAARLDLWSVLGKLANTARLTGRFAEADKLEQESRVLMS